jgi:hypothetical protein
MTDDLTFSLLNFEAGGLRSDGVHDFTGRTGALQDDPQADAVVVLCEAKGWYRDGNKPFLTAMRELSVLCGRQYVGELHTGPIGTAIIYDPTVLSLLRGEDPRFPDLRNRARFALRTDGLRHFEIRAEHRSYSDSREWFARAQRLAQYGTSHVPTLVVGDLNESPSGPDFPDLDWDTVPIAVRDYIAYRNEHGVWVRPAGARSRRGSIVTDNRSRREHRALSPSRSLARYLFAGPLRCRPGSLNHSTIRKQAGMPIDANSRVRNVDEELADVLIYVCAMANRFGIDLETAFREKEDLNKNRQWQASSEN